MSGLRGAVAFLTRIPVGSGLRDPATIARSVPWFPVVGAGVGLVVAGVYAAGLLALPPLVASTLAICAGVVLTGAFHEDGLGDVADAFWGGWDREERLRILKDPHLGTFGVLAIAASLLLRVGALASIGGSTSLVLLPAVHALSRSAAILGMAAYTPVASGLGASYVLSLTRSKAFLGMLGGALVATVALGWWAIPAIAIAGGAAWGVGELSRRKVGGISGDILGAIQQVAEVSLLLLGAAAGGGLGASWWRI